MVYVKKWAEFHSNCVDLCRRCPERTRYVIKATPSQQWLILKVTDDHTCLKFRARSAIIINRFESFTRDMSALMAGLPMSSAAATAPATAAPAQGMDVGTDGGSRAVGAAEGPSGQRQAAAAGGGGGATKKKKKKGKK